MDGRPTEDQNLCDVVEGVFDVHLKVVGVIFVVIVPKHEKEGIPVAEGDVISKGVTHLDQLKRQQEVK